MMRFLYILDLLMATYVILFNVTQGQQPQCTNTLIMVKKKLITEQVFQRIMKKQYKQLTVSIPQCVKQCFADERCTDVMLCNGGCYFIGVFNSNVLTTENYAWCSLFPMRRCKNGGHLQDSGYCSCPYGFGGRYCEMMIDDKCYNRWREVYDTESTGSNANLLNEAKKVCPVMMKVAHSGRVHNVDMYGVYGDVWAQTLHQLTKTSWDDFGTTPERRFDTVRSNRYMTTMRYSFKGTRVFSSTGTLAIKWFVKQHTNESTDYVSDGTSYSYQFDRLLEKVKHGAAVSLFNTVSVNSDETVITGGRLEVGLNHENSIDQFVYPEIWQQLRYQTSKRCICSRWFIGSATLAVFLDDQMPTSWCTDECWRKALAVEGNSNVSFGSASDLAGSILNGHDIRVYFNGMAAKTRDVYIHGHTLTALLDVDTFEANGGSKIIMTSTSGTVIIRKYVFDSGLVYAEAEELHSTQWYMDTRQWIKVLVVGGDGTQKYGSVTELKNFVMEAASVRLIVEYTSGMRHAMSVDHLQIADDGNVAADVINHSPVHNNGSKLSLDSATSYQWWSAIITTSGRFQKYHYTFKRDDGNTEQVGDVFTFSWFVQQ